MVSSGLPLERNTEEKKKETPLRKQMVTLRNRFWSMTCHTSEKTPVVVS